MKTAYKIIFGLIFGAAYLTVLGALFTRRPPRPAYQSGPSVNIRSLRRSSYRSSRMTNLNLAKGGAAVKVALAVGSIPAGMIAPAVNCFSVWENGTQVVADTPLSTLPSPASSGVNATAATVNVGGAFWDSVTLQAAFGSTVQVFGDATVLTNRQGTSVGKVDISKGSTEHYKVTSAGVAVNLPAYSNDNQAGRQSPAAGKFGINLGQTQIIPDTAIPASGASVTVNGITVKNTGETSTFTLSNQGGTFVFTIPVLSVQVASSTVSAASGYSVYVADASTSTQYGVSYFDLAGAAASSPLVPKGVTATAKPGLKVLLDAANNADQPPGTTYNLFESTSSGGEGTTPVVSGISLPYTRQEASAGVRYYQLQAVSGGTASAQSGEAGAQVYDTAAGTFRIQSLRSPRIAPGISEGVKMNVEADDGWTTPIMLSLACTGDGITGSFLGQPGAGSFVAGVATADVNDYSECVLVLSVALTTAPGTYPYTVTATSGGQTLTMQANVEVSASAASDADDGRGT